jgi:hypothetical protein
VRLSFSDSSALRMKSLSGSTMTSWLSIVPVSTPGGRDSMSAAAWIFPWDVFEDEVVVLEGSKPSGYASIDIFWVLPIEEVSMIRQDSDRLFRGG